MNYYKHFVLLSTNKPHMKYSNDINNWKFQNINVWPRDLPGLIFSCTKKKNEIPKYGQIMGNFWTRKSMWNIITPLLLQKSSIKMATGSRVCQYIILQAENEKNFIK